MGGGFTIDNPNSMYLVNVVYRLERKLKLFICNDAYRLY
ncbi:hypothetical protein BAOM_4259 [Peribacillus asahii]|uniref:Uncharacterized protein n=1 Tax=Peribacillus asahii TaxID=228899 RepID=A0A3T0KWY1_9BACI|nr:hypothetical protein BAOM_4259 [Peribacillus asahii]